jgi:hypothetical protein
MPKQRPYSWTLESAATLETPKSKCVQRSIRHRRVDPSVVLVILWELESRLGLVERQVIVVIAVDLVRRHEDERRVGLAVADGLEQVHRPVRVDAEVRLRVRGAPVVRRLGSGVDQQGQIPRMRAHNAAHAVGVADVERQRAKAAGVVGDQSLRRPRGRRRRTEEPGTHVVLETDDI